jgi:hypothetical protein
MEGVQWEILIPADKIQLYSCYPKLKLRLSLRTVFYLAVFIKEIPFYLSFPSFNFHVQLFP